MAIEPSQRKYWDQRSAEAITMHYRVGRISITGNAITSFLGALLPVIIIVIGAQQVFDQTLTVGALIAFQMISGRVVGPLISMVGLVNEYQETALSVRMMGEVMQRTAGLRRPGAAALDLAYVAAGRYEGFWERRLNSWDMAAGLVIVREAGGFIEPLNPKGDIFADGEVICANEAIFSTFAKVIRS